MATLLTTIVKVGAMRRMAGLLWVMCLVAGLYVTACSTPALNGIRIFGRDGAQAATDSTITISLQTPNAFKAQAIDPRSVGMVNHYTIKLYDWTGAALGTLRHTHYTTTGTVSQVQFTEVPPGMYKVTGEAFSSADESVSASEGGPVDSSNYVTVYNGSPPFYSSDFSLLLNIQLKHGIGDNVNLGVSVVDGLGENLAPDDNASPSVIHDYQITRNGVTSTFVWIPFFQAYQLVIPGNCGSTMRYGVEDQYRPVGYWVSTAPAAGTSGTDWQMQTFGGFYAGKYEASRADATASSAGGASDLAVRPMVVPWATVAWDQAAMVCRQYHPKAHLMGDEEWTALAVWTMINGITAGGNNSNGADTQNGGITFMADPTASGRALTGSGGNPTSHTGAGDGVFDLHGNVSEWTGDLGRAASHDNWLVTGVDIGQAAPTTPPDWVFSLLTGPYARYGIGVGGSPHAAFGDDGLIGAGLQAGKALRGGDFSHGTNAGMWFLATAPRTNTSPTVGFRPCLKF